MRTLVALTLLLLLASPVFAQSVEIERSPGAREPRPEVVHTVGLEQCVQQGKAAIGWDSKYGNATWRRAAASVAEACRGVAIRKSM